MPRQALNAIPTQPPGTEPIIIFPTPKATTTQMTQANHLPTPTPTRLRGRHSASADRAAETDSNKARGIKPTSTPDLKATAQAIERNSSIHSWNGKKRINVLLLGVDQRGAGESTRSDTIIVASLDFQHNEIHVVSIARDLYLYIPGIGYDRINAAYPLGESPMYSSQVGGGMGLLINTIRYNFGIKHIDAFGLVDFNGFVEGINEIGGVDVNVPRKLIDPAYPTKNYRTKRVVFNPGPQHMDGARALEYARTRHPDNDFGRIRRQQQVLSAVKAKARNPIILIKAPSILSTLGSHVKTNLSLSEQLRLARWAESVPRKNIHFYSITGPIGLTQNGMSVVWPQWDYLNPILQKAFGPSAGHR